MDKYKIIVTPDFEEELKKIYDYFKFFLKENRIANIFYQTIINSVFSLEYFPKRYHKLYNYLKCDKDIRKLTIKNYIIIYEVNEENRTNYNSTYILSENKII